MEIFLTYLKVFAVGGLVCLIGQILINKTKMTSARILVTFLLLGVVLEVSGAFQYIEEFGKAGATCRLAWRNLAKGAFKGVKKRNNGCYNGPVYQPWPGLTAAIIFWIYFCN